MAAYDLTTPSPPTTATIAGQMAAILAAQSGVLTDFNVGSQVRALLEAIASIIEINQIENESSTLQAIVNSCYEAFGITPKAATYAVGTVLFSTGTPTSSPASPISVPIPSATIVQTSGGIQFQTTSNATLASGASGVYVPVEALQSGTTGNVSTSGINSIVTGLQSPLLVTNLTPITGGANAESTQQTAARFANVVSSLHLSSPVAIAGACIGVSYGNEVVKYATVYEPWVNQSPGSQTVEFQVFIDNGSGTASSSLVSAVTGVLNGDTQNLTSSGYRPAGVPYTVNAVTPTLANVVVTAVTSAGTSSTQATSQISSAVNYYFEQLNFGDTAYDSELNTQVANAISGEVSSLTVTLQDSGGSPQTSITPPSTGRMLLNNLTLNVS